MAKTTKIAKLPARIPYSVIPGLMVTPKIATQMLKHNSYNRPLNHTKAKLYSEEMQSGDFMKNGDTIRYDWFGVLLDGQTRLTAIIDSGVSMECIIVHGLDPASFNTIDIGKIRTLPQLLSREGVQHSSIVAGMTAALIAYDLGREPWRTTCNIVGFRTPTTRIAYFMKNRIFLEPSIEFIVDHGDYLVGLKKAQFAFLYHIMARLDLTDAQQFFSAFFGDPNIKIDAAHMLKKRLTKDTYHTIRSSQMSAKKKMALMIKGWNLYRTHTVVGNKLSFQDGGKNPEKFPRVI